MTRVQKNLVGLGVLTAVVFAAGALAYYGVQKPEEEKQAQTERDNDLFAFEAGKAQKIVLAAQGAGITFEKSGEAWQVTAPVKTDADKAVAEGVLAKMGELKATRWVDVSADALSRFGLDKPLQTATVHVEGGAAHTLHLGATNNFDQQIYVRRGDEPRAALVESGARAPFDKSLFDAREKRVLVFEDNDVKSIAVTVGKNAYVLARDGGKWMLEKPIAERADDTTANAIANALKNLRATRFVTEQAAPADAKMHGLDKAKGRVVLTMAADNAQKTLELGEVMEGGAKKVYARRGEHAWLVEVAANAFDDLDKDLFALRDKTVVAFDREQLGKVEFTALDGAKLAVKREKKKKEGQSWEEEEFTVVEPSEAPAKRFKVSSLLYTLAAAKAASFVEEKPKALAKYGLDKAKVAAFYDKEGKLLGRLLVGDKKDDKVYAMAEGGARVVTLEGRILDEWPKSVEDFVEPPPAPPAPPATEAPAPSTPPG